MGHIKYKLKLLLRQHYHISCTLATSFRVHMGPGKPGKIWNFIVTFSRTGKSWKKATDPGKFWKSPIQVKSTLYEVYGRQ